MPSTRRELTERLAGGALVRFQRYLGRKKPGAASRVGERFGALLYALAGRRRRIAHENIARAFPDWPRDRIEQVARQSFINFGRSSADFLAGGSRSNDEIVSTTDVEGFEHLENALAAGKGVLLLTAHFGNFERGPAWVAARGLPVTIIIRDANQQGVNQVVNEIRTGPGTKVIPRGNSAREVITKLRANEIVGLAPDQNSPETFIPLFGHLAGTVLGPGVLHERTGAAAVPYFCIYQHPGRHKLKFFPPLTSVEGCDVRGEGLMRAYHSWLESIIREHPDQWLWMHDRWRSARKRGLA